MTAWNYWEGLPTSFLHSVWTIWRCKMVWPPQCIKFYTSSPVAQRSLQSCPFLSSILGWLNTRAATGQSANWSWGGWDFLHRALISRVESIFSHRRSRKESMTAEKKREKKTQRKVQRRRAPAALVQGLAHVAPFLVLVHPTRTWIRRNYAVACEEMEEAKKLTWEQKVERVPPSEWVSAGWTESDVFSILVVEFEGKLDTSTKTIGQGDCRMLCRMLCFSAMFIVRKLAIGRGPGALDFFSPLGPSPGMVRSGVCSTRGQGLVRRVETFTTACHITRMPGQQRGGAAPLVWHRLT